MNEENSIKGDQKKSVKVDENNSMKKEEDDVLLHRAKCMSEEDPNQNDVSQVSVKEKKPRWGPQHVGAMVLASQYTRG